jgi:hypothetical protein
MIRLIFKLQALRAQFYLADLERELYLPGAGAPITILARHFSWAGRFPFHCAVEINYHSTHDSWLRLEQR